MVMTFTSRAGLSVHHREFADGCGLKLNSARGPQSFMMKCLSANRLRAMSKQLKGSQLQRNVSSRLVAVMLPNAFFQTNATSTWRPSRCAQQSQHIAVLSSALLHGRKPKLRRPLRRLNSGIVGALCFIKVAKTFCAMVINQTGRRLSHTPPPPSLLVY